MNSGSPKISLVTPSLNQGSFIGDTVESVLGQGYPNLEYLIVDGGSTDNTQQILNEYRTRAKVLVGKDRGQTDALIKGFDLCTGEILGWINADDVLAEGALSLVAAQFQLEASADVIVGNLDIIGSSGEKLGSFRRIPMERDDWVRNCMSIPQPATFFSSALYRKVGGLDPDLEYSMDYDLFARMALSGARFHYIDDTLAGFRVHPESKSVRVPWRQWREEFIVYRRNGGSLFAPFTYWKGRSIVSYFIRRYLLRRSLSF